MNSYPVKTTTDSLSRLFPQLTGDELAEAQHHWRAFATILLRIETRLDAERSYAQDRVDQTKNLI